MAGPQRPSDRAAAHPRRRRSCSSRATHRSPKFADPAERSKTYLLFSAVPAKVPKIRAFCPKIKGSSRVSKMHLLSPSLAAQNFVPSFFGLVRFLFKHGRAGLTALRPFPFEFRGVCGKFPAFPHIGNCHYFGYPSASPGAGNPAAPLEMGNRVPAAGLFGPPKTTKVASVRIKMFLHVHAFNVPARARLTVA